MKKAMVIHAAKIAVAAGTLAVALTGCCLCGKKCCCPKSCSEQDKGCKTECCEKKSHGMNTSMTVGLGTDGVHAGGAANVGGHGVSGGVGGSAH